MDHFDVDLTKALGDGYSDRQISAKMAFILLNPAQGEFECRK
jgi:hypothetical protein